MKKFILILLLCTLSLFANEKEVNAIYRVSYGIFSELGIANANLKIIDNKNYYIKIEAKATGFAKFLSSGKMEVYESFGKIDKGTFVPTKFIKLSKNNYKRRKKIYTFDYNNMKVIVDETKEEKRRVYNSEFEQEIQHINKKSKYTLKYFAKDDLLSLFFNLNKKISTFAQGNSFELKAIGANKSKGIINIEIPNGNRYKELEESLESNNKIKFIAYINQKIFSSKRGELFIALNEHGFCSKALLKDVLLFGDIKGEMINFEIKENK